MGARQGPLHAQPELRFRQSAGVHQRPRLDSFNLANNYTVQSSNRTHIFNFAYSIELGNPVRNNKLAGGFVNGWQISGITQVQSGANLTGQRGQNFGMNTQQL